MENLLEKARASLPAKVEPPRSYRPFFLGPHRVGDVPPELLGVLREQPELEVTQERVRLPWASSLNERNRRLADLSARLRSLGLVLAWRGELLDLRAVDAPQEGEPLAQMERAFFRTVGARTQAVHLIAFERTAERRIRFPLGLRAKTKAVGPGLWDTLSAGMISAGETPLEALCRETGEEAGFSLRGRKPVLFARTPAERKVATGWMREESWFFALELPAGTRFVNQDGETERFESFGLPEVLALIPQHRLMWEAAEGVVLLAEKLLQNEPSPD